MAKMGTVLRVGVGELKIENWESEIKKEAVAMRQPLFQSR